MRYHPSNKYHILGGLLAAALLISGCFTEKKAVKQFDKMNDKFPGVIAKKCLENYPLTITGTDTLTLYDWVELPCDTVREEIIKPVGLVSGPHVPVKWKERIVLRVRTETKYITVYKEDSAKVTACNADIAKVTEDLRVMKGNYLSTKKWAYSGWIFAAALCLLLLLIIILLTKKNEAD